MRLWSAMLIGNVLLLSGCLSGSRPPVAAPLDASSAPPSRREGEASSLDDGTAGARLGSTTDLEGRLPLSGVLRTRLHVEFREDGARWADDEVAVVRDALAMLDDREVAEIQGTMFVRTHETPVTVGGSQAEAIHRVGVFTQAGRPRLLQEVHLSDAAALLRHDALVAMTLHELGHVIEQAPRNHARFAVMTAEADLELQRAEAWTVDRALVKEYTAATARINAMSASDRDVASDFVALVERAALAYASLRDLPELADVDFDRDRARREATLTDVLVRRDRARAQLAARAADNPALTELAPTIKLENTAGTAVRTWSQLRSRVRAATTRLVATSAAGDISTRLHAFIATMDANHIGPISDYTAKISLTEKLSQFQIEMFAESFCLWKTDRPGLRRAAPDLATWFEQGNHLK
jgi:hypothetical protein